MCTGRGVEEEGIQMIPHPQNSADGDASLGRRWQVSSGAIQGLQNGISGIESQILAELVFFV